MTSWKPGVGLCRESSVFNYSTFKMLMGTDEKPRDRDDLDLFGIDLTAKLNLFYVEPYELRNNEFLPKVIDRCFKFFVSYNVFPCICALLPNNTQVTYPWLFQHLLCKEWCIPIQSCDMIVKSWLGHGLSSYQIRYEMMDRKICVMEASRLEFSFNFSGDH